MENVARKDAEAYEKPEIREYGDLRELTAAYSSGNVTDVPSGTPVGNIFSTV